MKNKIKAISNVWQESNEIETFVFHTGEIYQIGKDGVIDLIVDHTEKSFLVVYDKLGAILVHDVKWILYYSEEELKNIKNEI